MYSDLKDYKPQNVEYVLPEHVKEVFPAELDFSGNSKNVKDAMRLIGEKFAATFPSNELVTRKLDDFEIRNIREEYCVLTENELPKRREHLEETLEEIKRMKKQAEESYAAVLMEVSKYAAEVKAGVREVLLPEKETFCIALSGYYLFYAYDREKKVFTLAKAVEVTNPSELWASEERNREVMMDMFGIEVPESPNPSENNDENEDF